MAALNPLTVQPHSYIGDIKGRPLDGGRVYFGEANKDPEVYPINVFLDADLTIAANQPALTKGGFLYANGDMAEIYSSELTYSVKALDSYGRQIFYKPIMNRDAGAAAIEDTLLSEGGASRVPNGSTSFNKLSNFLSVESNIKVGSNVFLTHIYQDLDLEGEGRLYTYQTEPLTNGVSVKTASGYLTRAFDGKVFIAEFGADDDATSNASDSQGEKGGHALCDALDMLRAQNNVPSELSLGVRCTYYIHPRAAGRIPLANLSNFTWSGGGSTVYGSFYVHWHPTEKKQGVHNNIQIRDTVFIGSTLKRNGELLIGSNMGFEFAQSDYIYVTGNTFIENMGRGHICDLMGARHVYIEDNTVMGSSYEIGRANKDSFSEAFQYNDSLAATSNAGVTSPFLPFLDGSAASHIYCRRNKFLPYKNPETGIISYCGRPFGNHDKGEYHNIYFDDNEVVNPHIYEGSTYEYTNAVLGLPGQYNIYVRGNKFTLDNGRSEIVYMRSRGLADSAEFERADFVISGNEVNITNIQASAIASPAPVIFTVKTFHGYGGVGDTVIDSTYINVDKNTLNIKGSTARLYSLILVKSAADNTKVDIIDNRLSADRALFWLTTDGETYGANQKYNVRENVFKCLNSTETDYAIDLRTASGEYGGTVDTTYNIDSNTLTGFHRFSKVAANPNNVVTYTNNKHYEVSATGTVAGMAATISIYNAGNYALAGNIMTYNKSHSPELTIGTVNPYIEPSVFRLVCVDKNDFTTKHPQNIPPV